jgi:hypothetical protein
MRIGWDDALVISTTTVLGRVIPAIFNPKLNGASSPCPTPYNKPTSTSKMQEFRVIVAPQKFTVIVLLV